LQYTLTIDWHKTAWWQRHQGTLTRADLISLQVVLKVAMACSGCEGAVRRVLTGKPGETAQQHLVPLDVAKLQQDCHWWKAFHSSFPFPAGVESVEINLKEQKVVVKGNVQPEDIFQTVSKTGKTTEFWQ
jgi:copper chaperone